MWNVCYCAVYSYTSNLVCNHCKMRSKRKAFTQFLRAIRSNYFLIDRNLESVVKIQRFMKNRYSNKVEAALKIQEAWLDYRETKQTCPICMSILGKDNSTTKCGHKFCTGCLLESVTRNVSCPMCREQLVENQEEPVNQVNYDYDEGYYDGLRDAYDEFRPRMREEIDIATQKAYDDGIVHGRSLASEDIRLLREEIKRLKQQIQIKNR